MKRLLRFAVIGLLATPVFGAKISGELDRYYRSYELAKSRNKSNTMELIKEKIKFMRSYYKDMDQKWTPKNNKQSYTELAKKLHDSLKNLASQSVFNKAERDFKEFESSKYIKEYTSKHKNRVNETFTKKYYEKVVADAKKKFMPINKGDVITVKTRVRSYTGKFAGMYGNRIKVGHYWVPTIDLSKELLERMNPELVKKNRIDYVQKNYYKARDAAALLYNRQVNNYVNGFRKKYYLDRSQKMIDVWTAQYRADVIRTMSELDTGRCKEFREYKTKKGRRNSDFGEDGGYPGSSSGPRGRGGYPGPRGRGGYAPPNSF